MLSANQILELSSECGITLAEFKMHKQPDDQAESEKDLVAGLGELFSRDGAALNFFAAGAYDYYRPLALASLESGLSSSLNSCCEFSLKEYEKLKKGVESQLAQFVSMPYVQVIPQGLCQVAQDLLLELYKHQQAAGTQVRRKVLLPSTLSPGFRHALQTLLKFHSIESVITGFDITTGRLDSSQLEYMDTDDLLAMVFPYTNFFAVLEDVAGIAEWARRHSVKTIVLSDAQSLCYLKPPAQLTDAIDFMLCDLQPLGLALNKKNNAFTLLAASDCSAKNKLIEPADACVLMRELVTVQAFFSCQSAQQIQQTGTLSRENLNRLIEQLTQIPGVSLKFNSANTCECVIHFAGIDLARALQILSGHNILAGYALGDDYPELANCLLIHCTDQHNGSMIERLVLKLSTVVKNLSTAACPVQPKFT